MNPTLGPVAVVLLLLTTTSCASPAQAVGSGLVGTGGLVVAGGTLALVASPRFDSGSDSYSSATPKGSTSSLGPLIVIGVGAAAIVAGGAVLIVDAVARDAKQPKGAAAPPPPPATPSAPSTPGYVW